MKLCTGIPDEIEVATVVDDETKCIPFVISLTTLVM